MARRTALDGSIEALDTSSLDGLLGYDVRRASLAMTEAFARRMAPLELGPVLFTILLLVCGNPGITASQLGSLLDLHSSNLVGMVKQLTERGLIDRRPHPDDVRALGLYPTAQGQSLARKARAVAQEADRDGTAGLSPEERATLSRLLRRLYRG